MTMPDRASAGPPVVRQDREPFRAPEQGPISVVFLVRSLNIGGAERQLVNLAKALRTRGESVVVVVFYRGGALEVDLAQSGVPTVVLDKRGRWEVLGFLVRLVRALRTARPQVLYTFLVEPSILSVLLRPFLPATRVVWGVRASNMDLGHYGWFPRVTFRLSCWLARLADLIIANSEAGAEYHRSRGYPDQNMIVVPNGFDLEQFRPDEGGGRRQRQEWGVPEHAKVVGLVGRLDPIKDHGTFLEAAALLRTDLPDVRFVCVGDGDPMRSAELRARASYLGISDAVVWVAQASNMRPVYNALDVLCSSSLSEAFSNVLGEAMACGVPCVATDVGDAKQIVGTCGLVVPPGDPKRLADGLRVILARADVELRRACRERVTERYSLTRMVAETERVLRACLDGATI